ncbi:hypothetical protein HYH02_005819 [Chlamydomonas schloesseri]|uniref:Uncharacterized protein n=1 Tax=Chlamydomonas schloesseri TaxID=2026947 RepID=A0A835WLQ4_9CHLO|nr:hypothetical protein HYH02_005819 [Chlamydomonas schloesseri]|eukprot:KAG2449070.1 hypothetical protein HYH02_005819 [Chlamydomonas schloesseri]
MASQWRSQLSVKAVDASAYPGIIAADKLVYPTSNGLTEAVLSRWFGKHPEFGLIFLDQATGRTVANCIVVALCERGWHLLTEGKVTESELDGDLLFDAARDDTIGLHVYHLEKSSSEYPQDVPRFGMVALDAIAEVLAALRRTRPPGRPLEVCGFSGLTVTRLGCSLFSNLYGCRERAYVCKEHLLLSEDGALEVHEAETQEELQRLLQPPSGGNGRGRTYVLRARMLVVTPDEPSLVWSAIPARA